MLIQTISHKVSGMSCKECKRSCRASLLCAACEKREQDVFEELGKTASQRASDQIWDSILTQDGVSIGTAACTNVPRGPGPMASALPLRDAIKRMEEQSKGHVPFRPAYLVMPPELYSQLGMQMTTFADDSDANYASARMDFRVFQDYGIRVKPWSSVLYGGCDIGGSDPYVPPVVWKDVKQPAKPSALIWCVVVAFLCWLMCAAAGVL